MPHVRLVTDSTAHFLNPDLVHRYDIAVVPLTIQVGNETFREGIDITTDQLFNRRSGLDSFPSSSAPSPQQFTALYREIAQSGDSILSIHLSSKLGDVYHNARLGAEPLRGRFNIQVIDSGAISVGLGWLVEEAARAAEAGMAADDIVRLVRGLSQKLYVIFFVDAPDYLANSGRFGRAHSILSGMLGVKPLLALEEGDLAPMEKVRNRQQAVEKLIEFIMEFSNLEHTVILQSTPQFTEDTRMLLNQLAIDVPEHKFPIAVYGPTLATWLGPDAMGVMVFEGEPEED
jgi:DegV family protein with EDD domain